MKSDLIFRRRAILFLVFVSIALGLAVHDRYSAAHLLLDAFIFALAAGIGLTRGDNEKSSD